MTDKAFIKIVADLMLSIRGLAEWGIKTENMTRDELEWEYVKRTPELRREAAQKLIDSGLSKRKAAEVLGVDEGTVRNDLRNNSAKDAENIRTPKATGSDETKARRAAIAEVAAAAGVTAAPSEKYRIVYADPPWDYGAHAQPDYHTEQRDHYPVMPLEDICALPVKDWVEEDAVLFLWTTSPFLEKTFQVVEAWGFTYKTSFVWDKIKHNMGHYNSVRHEFLLVCTRGACQPDVKQLFDSVWMEERGKHSRKPVWFYTMIEALYTHGRKLEMFSRQAREGWESHGHVDQIRAA